MDFQQILPEFIKVPNDLERIWLLTRAFMEGPTAYGPELTKAIYIQEMTRHCGFFQLASSFNDWLIPLLANCQAAGIVNNPGDPAERIPLQVNLAKALLFDWVCADGEFPLLETLRKQIECFLDVSPEYRAKNKLHVDG